MHSRYIWSWVSLALASLFLSTLARECVLEDQFLDSSEEVHEALAGCTTVIADKVSIGGASGRLVLPDVVNITGVISSTALFDSALSTPLMTSIEAPQLVHLGGLDLNSISSIANLSFPKLQHVAGQIRIEHPERYVNLDFPVLQDAKSIYLDGDFGRLGFRRLQRIDNDLIVSNCEGCKAQHTGKTTPDPVAILFPALESVGFIKLAGIISNISMPRLISAGPPTTPNEPEPDLHTRSNSSDSGIRLQMTEMSSPFELQLPSLSSVDKQLYIHGEIKKFVLHALPVLISAYTLFRSKPVSTCPAIHECVRSH
ncbi:hypothetical protein BDW67DRAFT_149741 [Aspergillus spinulosporus]